MDSNNVGWIIAICAVGGVFGLIGVVFLVVALRARQKAKTSLGWPTTPGTITASSLQEHRHYDSDEGVSYSYEPVIQYRYTVMGSEYTGSKISFGANTFGRAQAQQQVNTYQPGINVTVHYNPEKPEEAVLETEAAGGKVFIIVGAIFLLVALGACCISTIGLGMQLLQS